MKAPTPFGGGAATSSNKSSNSSSIAIISRKESSKMTYQPKSEYEVQFLRALREFKDSLTRLNDMKLSMQTLIGDLSGDPLGKQIEKLNTYLNKLSSTIHAFDTALIDKRQNSILLLSKREDISRQIEESKKLINQQSDVSKKSGNDYLYGQPLDDESQEMQKLLSCQSLNVQKKILQTQEQFRLHDKIHYNEISDNNSSYLSNFFHMKSNFERNSNSKESQTLSANRALFESLKNTYDRSKKFDSDSELLMRNLDSVLKLNQIEAERDSSFERKVSPSYNKLCRIPPIESEKSKSSLPKLLNSLPEEKGSFQALRKAVNSIPMKKFSYSDLISGHRKDSMRNKKALEKQSAKSELMGIASASMTMSSPEILTTRQSSQPLFTTPVFMAPSRKSDWISQDENLKLNKLNVTLSSTVKKVDVSVAARNALGKIFSDDSYSYNINAFYLQIGVLVQ